METTILCLLVIIIVLLIIIIFGIFGFACYKNPHWIRMARTRMSEGFSNLSEKLKVEKKKEEKTPMNRNSKDYHDDIFKPEARIAYYLGNVKDKKLFIKLYDKKFNDNVYIIDSSFLDDSNPYNDPSRSKAWGNYLDEMKQYYRHFKQTHPHYKENQLIFVPGDVSHTRQDVAFLSKTRPLYQSGHNVLLPLNNIRHWKPVSDVKMYDIPYDYKKNVIVWRGAATGKSKRVALVERYYNYPGKEINVGFTNFLDSYSGSRNPRFIKAKMSMAEQLQNKYIISVEGNDVASNLKWIMASNSLCIKPHSQTESWLMEGNLKPWVHYVPVKEDFSDLLEVYHWCLKNPEMCKQIISNANDYINRFLDGEQEFKIIDGVLEGYCKNITVF